LNGLMIASIFFMHIPRSSREREQQSAAWLAVCQTIEAA